MFKKISACLCWKMRDGRSLRERGPQEPMLTPERKEAHSIKTGQWRSVFWQIQRCFSSSWKKEVNSWYITLLTWLIDELPIPLYRKHFFKNFWKRHMFYTWRHVLYGSGTTLPFCNIVFAMVSLCFVSLPSIPINRPRPLGDSICSGYKSWKSTY